MLPGEQLNLALGEAVELFPSEHALRETVDLGSTVPLGASEENNEENDEENDEGGIA